LRLAAARRLISRTTWDTPFGGCAPGQDGPNCFGLQHVGEQSWLAL
jgi:hypothetical protein